VAGLAALQENALPEWKLRLRVDAGRPGDRGELGRVGAPLRARLSESEARPERAPGIERRQDQHGGDDDATASHGVVYYPAV